MNKSNEHNLRLEEENLGFWRRNLADFLTVSRLIIGFVVLSLSIAGESAYITAVILTLVGGMTDILDGKIARHYFSGQREGRLGKQDLEIDTIFILCALGYLSSSGVVIHWGIGWGWIGLVLIATILSRRKVKVLIVSEVTTVIALLVITLLYNPFIFGVIIAPAMAAGIIINYKRVLYMLFDYWPSLFSK